jgi:D-methionine transport system permease protein
MWFDRLLQGFIDTFLMVGVSSLIALLAGIPLAVILVTSGKGGIYEAPARLRNCSAPNDEPLTASNNCPSP